MAKLSKAELAKREELIQSMKKNKRNLVKKYGSDAEKVLYGRATNLAKKLAEQDMEQNKLREMVKTALMHPVSEKVNEDLNQAVILTDTDHENLMKNGSVTVNVGGKTVVVALKNFNVDMEDYEDSSLDEDLDLGHEDNEPHMIKAELYRIGKYAMELYQMVDGFEGEGEVDFPAWWQAKITTAMNNMVSSKHYLDFELKEPEIDAAVDAMTGEEPHMGEPQVMTVDLVGDEDEIEEGYLKASEVWRTLTGKNKKVVRKGAHTDTWKVPSSEDIQKMVDKDGGRYDDVLTNSVEFIGTDQGDYSLANATPDQVAKFKATLDPSDEFTPAIIGAIKDRIYKSGSKHHEERSDMVAPQTWKDHLQNLKWDIEKGTTKVMKRAGMLEEEAVNTRHIEDHEYMAAKIQKAMNGLDKSSEDYDSKLFILQKARKANNKGDFKTAMKIMKPFLAEVNELLDATPLPVVTKANSKIVDVPTMAKSLLDIYNDFKEREKIDFESNSYFKNAINFLTKAAQKQIDKETKATEVAETLAKQLKSK